MLKGLTGIKTIMAAVSGFLVLGLVGTAITVGGLGDSIRQGLSYSEEFTDYTTEIDASNPAEAKETFSDLTMFVRDRSVGCEEVEARNNGEPIEATDNGADGSDDPRHINGENVEEGYPGLDGTRLGQKPSCVGGESTVIREGIGGSIANTVTFWDDQAEDNQMSGILGRERFEITGESETELVFADSRTTLPEHETDYGENDYWLENNLAFVSNKAPEEHVRAGGESSDYKGTGRNYVVFFIPDVGNQRTNQLLENFEETRSYTPREDGRAQGPQEEQEMTFDDFVWRKVGEEGLALWDSDGDYGEDVVARYYANELKLCPGDKGFVQVNRRTPLNNGLPGETDGSENYYPMIVITEAGSCTDQEDLGDYEEYEGVPHANQLYIHEQRQQDWKHWQHYRTLNKIELRGVDEESPSRGGRTEGFKTLTGSYPEYSAVNPEDNYNPYKCEIYMRSDSYGRDRATLRTYELGQILGAQGNINTLDYNTEAHRTIIVRGGASGNDIIEYNSFDAERLIEGRGSSIALEFNNKYWNTGQGAGKLRIKTDNRGHNILHGDLLCADNDEFAVPQWHLCDESLPERLREIQVDGATYSCNPNSGSRGSGEWSLGVQNFEGNTEGHQLLIRGSGIEDPGYPYQDFRLHSENDPNIGSAPSFSSLRSDNEDISFGSSDSCEVGFAAAGGSELRTYRTGKQISKNVNNWEGISYTSETSDGNIEGVNEFIADMELNGNTKSDGMIRQFTKLLKWIEGSQVKHEMHGDLLCANPDDEGAAEWHMCHSSLVDSKKRMNVGGTDRLCDPSTGEWIYDPGSYENSQTSAYQLWIKAGIIDDNGEESADVNWPEAHNFDLKTDANRRGKSWFEGGLATNPSNNKCSIYYQERDVGGDTRDGATYRTYSEGTKISQNQETFRGSAGFEFEDSEHREVTRENDEGYSELPESERGEQNAFGLFNEISNDADEDGTGLDGRRISAEHTGQLRVEAEGNGYNILYGDLLCGTQPEERAKWHLCVENLDNKEMEIDGTTWTCDASSGVWSEE